MMKNNNNNNNNSVKKKSDVPKGCTAIKVGTEGEEQQRFVVPVMYLNHPLFIHLLKEAENEYGFDHNGPISIPCHVEQFRYVRALIDRDNSLSSGHHHNSHTHHNHHNHSNHNHLNCFRV